MAVLSTLQRTGKDYSSELYARRVQFAGKGFAVVASEVRALAEQSRTATVQVKEILTEIQR